jgi:hypothetical protein
MTELFESYPNLTDSGDKETLVARIIVELVVHARIEEGLFYPALRRANADATRVDEALVEHDVAKSLMRDLHGAKADAPCYDAKLSVLAALVTHHVEEEEAWIFEAARESDLDLSALGGQMDAYRAALRMRYALDTGGEEITDYLSIGAVVGVPERKPNAQPGTNRLGSARARKPRGGVTLGAPKSGPAKPRAPAVTTGAGRSRRSNRAAG